MESQGHYMETFSFLLVIHLCIDLFDFFAICLWSTYSFFILSNFIVLLFWFILLLHFFSISTHTPNAVILVKITFRFLARTMGAANRKKAGGGQYLH